MEFVGMKVTHTVFGAGTIVAFDQQYLSVEFAGQTKTFAYPDAFDGYLRLDAPDCDAVRDALRAKKDTERMDKNHQLERIAAMRKSQLAERAKERAAKRSANPTVPGPKVPLSPSTGTGTTGA